MQHLHKIVKRLILLSIALGIFSTAKAQEKPQAIEAIYPNTISYFAGLSGLVRYYYPDSLNLSIKDPYWSHTISYDRTLFPWLEAGAYLTHSFSNKFGRPLFTINLTSLGLEA